MAIHTYMSYYYYSAGWNLHPLLFHLLVRFWIHSNLQCHYPCWSQPQSLRRSYGSTDEQNWLHPLPDPHLHSYQSYSTQKWYQEALSSCQVLSNCLILCEEKMFPREMGISNSTQEVSLLFPASKNESFNCHKWNKNWKLEPNIPSLFDIEMVFDSFSWVVIQICHVFVAQDEYVYFVCIRMCGNLKPKYLILIFNFK